MLQNLNFYRLLKRVLLIRLHSPEPSFLAPVVGLAWEWDTWRLPEIAVLSLLPIVGISEVRIIPVLKNI